ncbi:MAG: hypothetical protein HZA31_04290 [Opitutae bacterium]|nr:hypothetical protein [Opitutae bacterium]
MSTDPQLLTPEAEARQLQELYQHDMSRCLAVIEGQYGTLQSRSQLILSLVTITLTITGFSGPHIAASGRVARVAITSGLSLSLLSALLVIAGILSLRWNTQLAAKDHHALLTHLIRRREQKTQFYRGALAILSLGLSLYTAAAAAFLLSR